MKYFLFFFISAGLVSLLLFATLLNWDFIFPGVQSPPKGGTIILFLGSATVLIFYFLQQRSGRAPEKFVNFYLGSVVLKLVTASVFILVLIYRNEKAAEVNAVFFMISYLLFTALEIVFLVHRKTPEKA